MPFAAGVAAAMLTATAVMTVSASMLCFAFASSACSRCGVVILSTCLACAVGCGCARCDCCDTARGPRRSSSTNALTSASTLARLPLSRGEAGSPDRGDAAFDRARGDEAAGNIGPRGRLEGRGDVGMCSHPGPGGGWLSTILRCCQPALARPAAQLSHTAQQASIQYFFDFYFVRSLVFADPPVLVSFHGPVA